MIFPNLVCEFFDIDGFYRILIRASKGEIFFCVEPFEMASRIGFDSLIAVLFQECFKLVEPDFVWLDDGLLEQFFSFHQYSIKIYTILQAIVKIALSLYTKST